jgi:hypothetical protein
LLSPAGRRGVSAPHDRSGSSPTGRARSTGRNRPSSGRPQANVDGAVKRCPTWRVSRMMRLDLAFADTSALLSLVAVLPLEPLDIASINATDVSLIEVVAVLRDFHDGRGSDILGASPGSARW